MPCSAVGESSGRVQLCGGRRALRARLASIASTEWHVGYKKEKMAALGINEDLLEMRRVETEVRNHANAGRHHQEAPRTDSQCCVDGFLG